MKEDEKRGEEDLKRIVSYVCEKKHTLCIVTNEIGLGVIPIDKISRRYSDVLGRYNQFLALVSDEVYFVVSGILWRLK